MIFGLNALVIVVKCLLPMSFLCRGIKIARKSRMRLPNAAAWFVSGGSCLARSTIMVE